MKWTGAGRPLGTYAGYGTHFNSDISPWKCINWLLILRLIRILHAWRPFLRLPCLDRPITGPLLARYRPLSSFRLQHQDVTISGEQVRRTAASRRYWVAVYCHFGRPSLGGGAGEE